MISMIQAGRRLALLSVALSTTLTLNPLARAAPEPPAQAAPTQGSEGDTTQHMNTVTIEARRELEHQISHFVSSVIIRYLNDSMVRWDSPICPAVAGLSKDDGEFVLARVSQIARVAQAPLGTEHCKPNFFVVAADNPDALVAKWVKRFHAKLNTCNGLGYVKDFLHARTPIRVWYNIQYRLDGKIDRSLGALDLMGVRVDLSYGPCTVVGAGDSRLSYGAVQALSSVIIVADSKRIRALNIGQLADYVAMVGLAQIRLDGDTGTAPTILRLFQQADPRPQGLSPWDRSFLYGLYTTDQSSVMQMGAIKRRMLEQIAAR